MIFGIGAGHARSADPALTAIAEREYGAYGIDVVPVRDAIDALGEALTIARRLWTESTPFDFEGAHYRLSGAICEPKPAARLPILIGARLIHPDHRPPHGLPLDRRRSDHKLHAEPEDERHRDLVPVMPEVADWVQNGFRDRRE